VLVTPLVLSNGGHPTPSSYPYSDAVFEAAEADPLQFDTAGDRDHHRHADAL
jgi:hypothetical protein